MNGVEYLMSLAGIFDSGGNEMFTAYVYELNENMEMMIEPQTLYVKARTEYDAVKLIVNSSLQLPREIMAITRSNWYHVTDADGVVWLKIDIRPGVIINVVTCNGPQKLELITGDTAWRILQ